MRISDWSSDVCSSDLQEDLPPKEPRTTLADAPRLSLFRPFRHRTFRSVWIASTVSNFGGLIEGVGAAWMMVLLSAPASMIALVQASKALPVMLLSLLAGAIADQFDRRLVLTGAQRFLFIASAGLCRVPFFDFAPSGFLPRFPLGTTSGGEES